MDLPDGRTPHPGTCNRAAPCIESTLIVLGRANFGPQRSPGEPNGRPSPGPASEPQTGRAGSFRSWGGGRPAGQRAERPYWRGMDEFGGPRPQPGKKPRHTSTTSTRTSARTLLGFDNKEAGPTAYHGPATPLTRNLRQTVVKGRHRVGALLGCERFVGQRQLLSGLSCRRMFSRDGSVVS